MKIRYSLLIGFFLSLASGLFVSETCILVCNDTRGWPVPYATALFDGVDFIFFLINTMLWAIVTWIIGLIAIKRSKY